MSQPIRILHVLGRLDRGGAETMVMNLYRSMDRSKIQFDFVICTTDKCDYTDEIYSLGGRIYSFPKFSLKNSLSFVKAWNEFFKEHKEYKIVHGHLRSTASIYLSIAKRYGLVTIVHSHSTSSGNGFSALVKNILQLPIRFIADFLFSCSDIAGIWLFGEKAVKKDNYFLLNNAINTEEFIFNEDKRIEVRKRLQLENKFVIGHIGAFRLQKNHEFIIQIFKEVYKQCDRAVLLLIGDGELRTKTQKMVNDFGLNDAVRFTGIRQDIPDLLQAMDVFLFPSIWEGLPVTLIEAQASGLKCIISDTISKQSCVTDLVEFVSLSESPEEWAKRILMIDNGYIRKNTSSEIKNAKYDIEVTKKWLELFYLNLAEGKNKEYKIRMKV